MRRNARARIAYVSRESLRSIIFVETGRRAGGESGATMASRELWPVWHVITLAGTCEFEFVGLAGG